MSKPGYAYILASVRHGTLYTGVTSDLILRVSQHRLGTFDGFTAKYGVKRLVWYQLHEDIADAIAHEKRLKNWKRDWKIGLIEADNPEWRDIALDFGFEPLPLIKREFRSI